MNALQRNDMLPDPIFGEGQAEIGPKFPGKPRCSQLHANNQQRALRVKADSDKTVTERLATNRG